MAKPVVEDADGDPQRYGDPLPFDPNFKGPIKNRSCTDILCLFLFVAFIAGWAVVAYFAYSAGNPKALLHPTDSSGNICGTGKFEDRKFLYFFDITQCLRTSVVFKGCNTPQVCVNKCPERSFYCNKDGDCPGTKVTSEDLICEYKTDKSKDVKELIKSNKCATFYLQSSPLAGRCLPIQLDQLTGKDGNKISKEDMEKVGKNLAELMNARDVGVRIFQDFSAAWWLMIVFLLFSMLVSFLWILLMRWIAGFMVYLSIILVVGLLGAAAGISFYTYVQIDQHKDVDAFKLEIVRNLNTVTSSKRTWLISGIIFGVIWIIMVLMLIFLRKRINLAIALIKEGSKAVGSTISSLFFPLFPYLLQLAIFVFWGSVAIYIASSGKGKGNFVDENGAVTNETCSMDEEHDKLKCMFTKYSGEDNLFRAQIYNLFGLFWGLFFAVGIGQVALAGAFASYYWAFEKPRDVPYFAVAGGLYRAVRFHMGSVAFGSLLISIVRMIRVMLDYIDTQCKKYKNAFTKVIIMCCKCCFWCLEKFMRFISKNAYIMMSVYGKNFCASARESFKLLMRNVVRVVVLDKVTDYLLLLGKLVVVGVTAVAAFFFFSGKVPYLKDYQPDLNYYFLPVITVTIGSYLIATGFFNVYSMAVDTLFLCFLEDCERNDGSPERPYYMSRELMKILDKKNKFRDHQK